MSSKEMLNMTDQYLPRTLCCEESFGTESEGIREKGGIDMTANTAIDSIYAVYGQQTSVTQDH